MKKNDQKPMLDTLDIILFAVKKRMREKGMTLAELSERSGTDPSNISYKLNRKRRLYMDDFIRICEVLDIEIHLTEKEGKTK